MTSSRKNDGSTRSRGGARKTAKGTFLSTSKGVTTKASKTVAASALSRTVNKPLAPQTPARVIVGKPQAAKGEAWLLQDAKARFSELVRRVKNEGPQQVSVHGKVEVVVVSADEFRRMKGERTGAALVAAFQASPHRDVEIAPARAPMPVRTVEL